MRQLALTMMLVATRSAEAQPDSFALAGLHPFAVQQRTVSGRALKTLFAWKGLLYAGYGDYGANTGPITIAAFDPRGRTFDSVALANSEAVFNMRAIRGRVYAPAIDRKLYSEPGDYLMLDTNGVWSNRNCGSTTHAFDVVTLAANDLWIVGSQETRAAVFRSVDDGATWKTVLRDTAITGNPSDFARYYFAGVYNGRLYVQARDYYGPMHPRSQVFDGTTWSDGPDLFPGAGNSLGWRPDTIAGQMVYRSWEPGQSTPLRAFDGTSVRWINSMYVRDVVMHDGYIYALVDSGYGTITIQRTRDLNTWERIARVPFEAISLAVTDGKYYVGTTDSKILEYVGPRVSSVEALQHRASMLSVRPTPATDVLLIDVGGSTGTLRLVDAVGREVLTRAVDGSRKTVSLDVRHIATGVYHALFGSLHAALVIAR